MQEGISEPVVPAVASFAGDSSLDTGPQEVAESDGIAPSLEHRPVIFTLAWLCAGLSLLGSLTRAGIWDPPELEVAELSRRIAVNLMGGSSLALPGFDNRVPILSELGQGQLPFSSMALGFRLFGLHDWAGRLPLALWGMLGVLATYLLVRRLLDKAGGPFAVLVLASCPLYFLQARTMLGDVVTMASLAIACTGLALAIFDREIRPRSWQWWASVAIGVLGLLCGFACRGVLLGVALPCLGVALTALLLRPLRVGPLRDESWRSLRNGVALANLVVGLVALTLGVRALLGTSADDYSMLVGAQIAPPKHLPTHDTVLHALGHGLLPWSALLPFAMGAVLRPSLVMDASRAAAETALRTFVIVLSTLAILMHGLMAPFIGELPFSAVFVFAVAVAILVRDLERGRPATLATGIGALALLVLLVMDYRQFAEKALSAFTVGDGKVPDSFKDLGKRYLTIGAGLACVACIAGFWEQDKPCGPTVEGESRGWRRIRASFAARCRLLVSREFWRSQAGFNREDYRAWPLALRDLAHGNPLYVLVPIELVLLVLFIEERTPKKAFHLIPSAWLAQVPKPLVNFGWAGFLGLMLLPFAVLIFRDMFRVMFRLIPVTRATVATLGFAAFGLVLSFGYYPALAAQMSPREVFDSYRQFAAEGDELGMIGASSGASAYYTGSNTQVFDGMSQAATWLLQPSAPRRYLVLASGELGKLNSQYRAQATPPRNLPVVDARSSEIMLVSNRLGPGPNRNPLQSVVLDEKPKFAHAVTASFEDEIDCIGWEIVTSQGQPTDSLTSGTTYHFRTYYAVRSKVSGTWKAFIHLDGAERINLDHDITAGQYPMSLWNKGDFIVDDHEFKIARGQAAGQYSVNFGLFQGSRRKKVTQGNHVDDRLSVGEITIR